MPAFRAENLARAPSVGLPVSEPCMGDPGAELGTSERDDLTDDILLTVFRILAANHGPEAQAASPQAAGKHFAWFRRVLPLVCRRWSALLGPGGKYGWDAVVVSVESEVARRRRPEAPLGVTAAAGGGTGGHGGSASAVPGSSPTCASPMMLFARPSLGPLAVLHAAGVVAWAEGRAGGMQDLLLDFSSASHDFSGHALEALLRAANRGPRGLRTLRLIGAAGVGGQDSYEVLARLRGLAELHVAGLPQGFLAGTLPYLTSLTGLTRLSFTPEAFQFPVTVPALPRHLRALTLSQLWLSRLPPIAASAPGLTELQLLRCYLLEGVMDSLAGAPALAVLRLDGSGLTTPAGGRTGWEAPGAWPLSSSTAAAAAEAAGGGGACPALTALHLAGCSLRALPPRALLRFAPRLRLLDLSNNPDLGGASSVPDAAAGAAAAAASASCLPPELAQLPELCEVRLAGCGLTAVPAALLACPALTALDLSSNSLSALPLPPPPSAAGAFGAGAAAWSPVKTAVAAAGLGGGGGASAPGCSAAFAERLVRLNIATNRFTVWPQGLVCCGRLAELVLGAALLGRCGEGELERCVAGLPRLAVLEVRGASFEPRAVRGLLGVQRMAAAAGRPRIEVTGLQP